MSVRRLLREMDSAEIHEWMAYYSIEPWGWKNTWRQVARICSATVNVWREKHEQIDEEIFIPKPEWPGEKAEQMPEEHEQALRIMSSALGGK